LLAAVAQPFESCISPNRWQSMPSTICTDRREKLGPVACDREYRVKDG